MTLKGCEVDLSLSKQFELVGGQGDEWPSPRGHPGFSSVIHKDVVSLGFEKAGSPPHQCFGAWGGRKKGGQIGAG